MEWTKLFAVLIQLAIFAVYISSIIEVIKGISVIGFGGAITGIIKTLWKNDQIKGDAFPVLNFAIALLCSWAFNITIMSHLFSSVMTLQSAGDPLQQFFARWIDYFGTASVTYLGSDQLFKRFLAVERQAKEVLTEVNS